MTVPQPQASEYAPGFDKYVQRMAPNIDPVAVFTRQLTDFPAFLHSIPPLKRTHRYAEGKWSIQEIVGHLIDTERILAYRARRIGRGDKVALPGFEENDYVPAAQHEAVAWDELIAEFESVRRSTIELFRHFPASAWEQVGNANGHPMSLRALSYIIPGHVEHHTAIIRERYL
jgi:hypothetical protein